MELIVDIKKKFSGFNLDVNFVAGNNGVGLLGASGSGKSMTLRCIAGLEKPDRGKIILNGKTLFDSERKVNISCQKRKIGFLFQNYALFPNMTVEENIGFALGSLDRKKRKSKIDEMIAMVRLHKLEKRYPYQLSGGQQQRVALARALAIEPEALFLDEPFSALDDHLRSLMVKQMVETITNYHGVTMFVTHNMEEAYRICNDLIVLDRGKIEASGNKESIFQNPPNKIAAKLTGCKNFSRARYINEYQLDALDWGIKLVTMDKMVHDISDVGIRANYIRLANCEDKKNVFECWLSFASETPFRMTLYLSIGKKPVGTDDYQLQWEISKEKWAAIKEMELPWKICLSTEKLMTLPGRIS